MCFRKDCSPPVTSYIKWGSFWTLRDNVGYGYRNNKADVLLVQYFLNVINCEWNEGLYLGPWKVEEDGKFGGETWGAIKSFQKKMGCVPDGMISAVNGDRLRSPKKSLVYTVIDMNRLYVQYRRDSFMDLKKDPDLPIDLHDHLTVNF